MALPTIENNKLGQRVTFLATANATANVTGNSSTCDIALVNPVSNTSEIVNSTQITQVWWGCSNNTFWTVTKGANTVLVLNNSGYMKFAEQGSSISAFANSANVNFTLSGTGTGFCRLELSKQSTYDTSIGA